MTNVFLRDQQYREYMHRNSKQQIVGEVRKLETVGMPVSSHSRIYIEKSHPTNVKNCFQHNPLVTGSYTVCDHPHKQ